MIIDRIAALATAGEHKTDKILRDSAEQFEALLIAQLLKAARDECTSGDTESIRDMAEQQLSAIMAKNGGLGLGTLITQGLAQQK